MTDEENVYKTIKNRSISIIDNGPEWKKALSSAKNYITTPDLKSWAFGKSAGVNDKYLPHGGTAKKWLYSIGFTDILKLPNGNFRKSVLDAFISWAKNVKAYDIIGKYNKDQQNNKRFEILVHNTLVPKSLLKTTNISKSNQTFFDEGFKITITKEITARSKKVIDDAKIKHGTKCAVCHFDFEYVYGIHGLGFIEMHHLYPIKNGERKTTVDDLRPVCANCHRMLHKGERLLDIDELKKIIDEQNKNRHRET